MWYYGKKRDTFSCAINILFTEKGYEKIPFLDCVSGRAFCMECKKSVKWWFETAVSIPKALDHINDFVFGGEGVIKCAGNAALSAENRHMLLQEGCVTGPIRKETSITHLQDRFYQGNQYYFFVKREADGRIRITDPLGIPIYYVDDRNTENVLEWGEYVIWMQPSKTTLQTAEVDWDTVLKNGFDRYKIHSAEPCSIKRYNFSDHYQSCSSAHTSLHMALNHYLTQMAEIGNLLDTLYRDIVFRRKLKDLFWQVSEVKYTEDLGSFQGINNQIWELLYEKFRVYKIDKFQHGSFELQ